MDVIHNGDEEPVFELGEEPGDEPVETTPARGLQLDTLFTPQALAMAGTGLALLAALGPFTSFFNIISPLVQFGSEPPSKGWILGPHIGLAATGLLLGLASWRMALRTAREVPRLAGVAVVIGAAMVLLLGIVWSYEWAPSNESAG